MTAAPNSASKRVLVIDDEALIALLAADHLVEMGHIVVGPAYTFSEARRLADVASIDAALVDLNLNGVSALPIADVLARRKIPFVFVTGYERPSLGAHENIGFLNKPYQSGDLRRVINRLLTQ